MKQNRMENKMNMPLAAALAQLDPSNDDHWTGDGLPVLAVLSEWTGNKVTRKDVPSDIKRSDAPEPTSFVADKTIEEEFEDQEILAKASDAQSVKEDEEVNLDEFDDEEILAAEPSDLGNDIDALERWIAAADRKLNGLQKAHNKLTNEINLWARRSDIIVRVRDRVRKSRPETDKTSIKTFLERQAAARAEKAERARAFIAAGTTAQDVVKELGIKAPIDQAMGQRKASLGSTRPAMGLPVRK